MSTGSTTGSASLRASPAATADASGSGLPRASTSLSSSTGSTGSSVIRSASALTDAPTTPRRSVPALRPTHGHMRHPSNTVIDMGGFSWDDHGSSALAAASAGAVVNGDTPPIAEDPSSIATMGASGLPGASPTSPATVSVGARGTPGARTGGARSKVQHLLSQFQDHEYAAAAGAPASVAYYSRHVAGPPPPLSLDRARGMTLDDQVGPSSAPLRTGSMHHPTPPGATATVEQELGASELGTVLDMSLFGFPGAADASRPSTAGTAATYGMSRLSLGPEPPADATGILPGAMPVMPHLVQREETSNRSHASLLTDDYNPTTAAPSADSPFPIEDHLVMDTDHPPPPPGAYLHHTPPTSLTTVASAPSSSAAAAYYARYPPPPTLPMPVTSGGHPSEFGHQLDWPIAPTQLFGYAPAAPPPPPPPQAMLTSPRTALIGGVPPPPPPAMHSTLRAPPPPPLSTTAAPRPPNGLDGSGAHRRSPSASSSSAVRMLPASGMASAAVMAPGNTAQPTSARASRGSALGLAPASASSTATRPPASPTRGLSWTEHDGLPPPQTTSSRSARTSRMSFLAPGASAGGPAATSGTNSGPGSGSATPTGGARARSRSPMAAVASAFASLLKSPNTGSAPLLPTAGGGARGNAGSSPRTSTANLGTSGETAGGLSPPAATGSRRKSLRQSLTGVLSAVTAKSADELRSGGGGGGGGTAGRTKSPYDTAAAANGASPQTSARAVSFADASGRPTSRTFSRSASGADARAKTGGDANGKADPAAAAAPASTSSGKKSRTPVQQLQFAGARRDLRAYVAARGLESPWTVMQSSSRRPKSTSSSAVSSAAATAAAALLGPTGGGGGGVRGRNGAAMDHRKSVVRRSRDSLLSKLTMLIVYTYRDSNPAFHYTPRANPRRVLTKPSKPMRNDGYDNEDNDYILYVNDTLGDDADRRYVIIDLLGQGTFGQVVKCQNLKTKEVVAVKVIKNKPAYFNQSLTEVKVLELLNHKYDKNDTHHILRLKDSFVFRRHLCLVFEQLSINLYELIKQNQFRGLSLKLVRVFTAQILDALVCLAEAKLIHADLKPENLLLKNAHDTQIKVIDLGSACQEQQTVYTYIQSRFYRSPEVLLGLPYTNAIDMWSLGCIVAELFLGLPLFPGTSEYNQVSRIVDMLGMPPTYMIEVGKNAKAFFVKIADSTPAAGPHAPRIPAVYRLKPREQYAKEHGTTEQPSKRYFAGTTLAEVVMQYPYSRRLQGADLDNERRTRECLLDFLRGLLHLNPIERWSAAQARMHPFISGAPWRGPWTPTAATAALAATRGNDANASVPSSAAVQQDSAHDTESGHRTLRKRAKTISTGPAGAGGSASTGHLPAVGSGPMLPPHMVVGADPAADDAAAAAERQQRRKSSIADHTAATQNRVRKVSSFETMAAAAAAAGSDPSAQQQQQQVPPHPYAVSASAGSLMGGSQSTGSLLQGTAPTHGAGGETLGIPILRKGRSQSISVGVGGVGIGPGSSATIMKGKKKKKKKIMSAAAGWPYWPPPPTPAHMHAQDLAMATPGTYPGLGEFDQQRYAAYVQQQQQQQQQHPQQQQAAGAPPMPPPGYYGTSYQHSSSMMQHMAAAAAANQRTMQGFATGGAPPPAGYATTRGAYYSGPSTSMPLGGPILPTWNPTNSRVIPAHLEYTGGATTDDEEWRDIEEGYMGASPGPDTPAGTPSTAALTGPLQQGMVVPGGFPSSTSSLGSPAASAASASAARRASLAAAAVAAAASGALLPPPQGISPSMLAAAATPGTYHHVHHQQPYLDQVVGMPIPGSFGPSGGASGTGGTAPRFHLAPQQSPLRTTLGDESAAAGSSSELSTIQEQPVSTSLPK
ncbi:CMGC/DYRK/YAK protein kinase [Allomyces macrogynus ATCC 38327]|uniref:CMGC/DYRK/YAK protein kinase n=1 Tax=Allomyces macrogynus (strain ATCC 38327) TaxID=578462 RepID=A0A0L0SZ42_ALLM3|nr:CMGC/DYRK/YAK protein kinase [Allomyces macrogynus ATCC 38327]|eukprot:KNE67776.1 CMGC/DYRK/YAK protein kinase [Allomyces macrogynus ATCC 38327]